jgi:hypothetical protein
MGLDMATVLFVCQHGAAKSVVAAALWQRLAAEAGLLAEGIDLGDQRPLAVSGEDVSAAWRVVSFGPSR